MKSLNVKNLENGKRYDYGFNVGRVVNHHQLFIGTTIFDREMSWIYVTEFLFLHKISTVEN